MMNLQGNQMQKVQSVISIIILSLNINCFSQSSVEGTYTSKYNSATYHFNTKNIFEIKFFEATHGLLKGYAKGHYYLITKDSLILNYDLTKLKEESYFKAKKYYNYNDSITINLTVYDFNKNPIQNVTVYTYPNNVLTTTNKNGKTTLKLKKEKLKNGITLDLDGEFLAAQTINIDYDANYIINAYMSKSKMASFGHLKAYKNQTIGYKILKLSKNEIKLKTKNSFLHLKKAKD